MAQDAGSHNPTNTVTVRNTTRTSLSFRVPGQSLRLSPGATIELPRSSLGSPEVKALIARSALAAVEPASPGAAPGPAPAPERKPHKRTHDR